MLPNLDWYTSFTYSAGDGAQGLLHMPGKYSTTELHPQP
jgi:hypothetical protein